MINPYLRLPIVLPGNDGEDEKEAEARIQPDQIQVYQPAYHWGSLIYMLGGSCVLMTRLTCDELDRIFDAYWKAVEKRAADKEITPNILTLS